MCLGTGFFSVRCLPAALNREFYSNLSVYSEVIGGHYLTSWIRGQEFTITKQTISEALDVPLVCKPTYPYAEFPTIDDMMSLLCGRPVSWGTEPRINSCKFTELNSLYLLGSKTLGTKRIRTSMCNVLENHDQNLESRFRLLKVYLFVKLELSNCRIYMSKSARLDRSNLV